MIEIPLKYEYWDSDTLFNAVFEFDQEFLERQKPRDREVEHTNLLGETIKISIGMPELIDITDGICAHRAMLFGSGKREFDESYRYFVIETAANFWSTKHVHMVEAELEVDFGQASLNRTGSRGIPVKVLDLYPRRIDSYTTAKRKYEVSGGLKFKFSLSPVIEAGPEVGAKIVNESEIIVWTPRVVAYDILGEHPCWAFTEDSGGLRGPRLLFMLVRTSAERRLAARFRLEAKVQTKWGLMPAPIARWYVEGTDRLVAEKIYYLGK